MSPLVESFFETLFTGLEGASPGLDKLDHRALEHREGCLPRVER